MKALIILLFFILNNQIVYNNKNKEFYSTDDISNTLSVELTFTRNIVDKMQSELSSFNNDTSNTPPTITPTPSDTPVTKTEQLSKASDISNTKPSEISTIINDKSDIKPSEISTSINDKSDNKPSEISITINDISNAISSDTSDNTNSKLLSTIPTTTPTPVFFELCILQARIIDNLLKIYATTTTEIKRLSYINITISLYKNINALRFLQDKKLYYKNHPVTLYRDESESLAVGKIFELTSKQIFPNEDTIIIDNKKTSQYEMKLLNNNENILNTKENENMISNGEMIDLSINKDFDAINIYTIASPSSLDCDFTLSSRTKILEEDTEINLRFTQRDNINNYVNAKCKLSGTNSQISCTFSPKVNNYYCLDSFIGISDQGIFYIEPEDSENYFKINCEKKEDSNLATILISVGAALLGIIIVIIVIVCIKKRKNSFEYTPKKRKDRRLDDASDEGMGISWNARGSY